MRLAAAPSVRWEGSSSGVQGQPCPVLPAGARDRGENWGGSLLLERRKNKKDPTLIMKQREVFIWALVNEGGLI